MYETLLNKKSDKRFQVSAFFPKIIDGGSLTYIKLCVKLIWKCVCGRALFHTYSSAWRVGGVPSSNFKISQKYHHSDEFKIIHVGKPLMGLLTCLTTFLDESGILEMDGILMFADLHCSVELKINNKLFTLSKYSS